MTLTTIFCPIGICIDEKYIQFTDVQDHIFPVKKIQVSDVTFNDSHLNSFFPLLIFSPA